MRPHVAAVPQGLPGRKGLRGRLVADPHAAALAAAREIASRSPDAVRALKRLFNAQSSPAAPAGLRAECVEQQVLLGTPNQVETVRASREKRAAVFTD